MEEDNKVCECGDSTSCTHEEQPEVTSSETTQVESGSANEETLFALLLALTPLAVFTLFGQIGLL